MTQQQLESLNAQLLAALIDLVQQVESGFFDHISTEHPASAVIAAKAIINKATGEQA